MAGMEQWIAPDDTPTEVDIEPDVFYDFFFSLPSIKAKNALNNLKKDYLEKIKEADFNDAQFDNLNTKGLEDDKTQYEEMKKIENKYQAEILQGKKLPNHEIHKWKEAAERCTSQLKHSLQRKLTLTGLMDAMFLKAGYALLINFIVIFLIFSIMNTISSTGLPGRQQLDDATAFAVILKADRTVTVQDRFNKPEGITDVCQGLGWWMQDDSVFSSGAWDMPTGDKLRDTTKEHWDPYLNDKYNCPGIFDTLENELLDGDNNKTCSKVHPESSTWKGDTETPQWFLFQDQASSWMSKSEVYNKQGRVLTLKATGASKEFTSMSGNHNGKVQQLQPLNPFGPNGAFVNGLKMRPFWVALDRIWPSEWTVQALFTLDWNARRGWDENMIVGGFNEFGRRPTAIVKANGYERYGTMIEEAMWQYLERSCWHKHDPVSLAKTKFDAKNKYDLTAEEPVMWEDLDQDVRDWWRALGLGVDRTSCEVASTRVTKHTCLSGKDNCNRVNYHATRRWNSHNDDAIAKKNFDARDFSSIFFSYSCEKEEVDNAGKLVITPIVGAPAKERLTWDKIELADDGKILEAATNLGYDQDEWNKHHQNPTSPPPDNLVIYVENYLEGVAYMSTFFWVQVICSMIMIAVSLVEIRNIFMWWHYTKGKKVKWLEIVKSDSARMRMWSFGIAFISYICIPVLAIEVSLLLLLESGSSLDVIKDTVALLFLLDINNHLQIRNAPDASKWKATLTSKRVSRLEKHKNVFSMTLFCIFAGLAIITIFCVYTGAVQSGFTSNFHPSIIFNPLRLRGVEVNSEAWGLFIVLVIFVMVAMIISDIVVIVGEKVEKVVADLLDAENENSFYGRRLKWIQESFLPEEEMDVEVTDPVDDSFIEQSEGGSSGSSGEPEEPPPVPPAGLPRGRWVPGYANGRPVEELVTFDDERVVAQRQPGLKEGHVMYFNREGAPVFGPTGSGPISPGQVPMPQAPIFMPHPTSAGLSAPSVNGSVQFSNMPPVVTAPPNDPFNGSAPPGIFPA